MPPGATEEQLRAWRAHAEAIAAVGPRFRYVASPAYVASLEAALRAGVPRTALRRQFLRIHERLRARALEELARAEEAADPPVGRAGT